MTLFLRANVTRAALVISPLLGGALGCNAILGTDPPLPLGAGGAGGGTGSTSTTSASTTSTSTTSTSTTGTSTTSGSTSGTGGGGGQGICGDDSWAHWSPGAAQVFTPMNADQYVVDSLTGLTWQSPPTHLTMSYPGAEAYCSTLSWGGLSGFRLPTRAELQSIVDYGTISPALDAAAFPGTDNAPYWTSSVYQEVGKSRRYVMEFSTGAITKLDEGAAGWVRCVIAAHPAGDPGCKRYTLTNGTATDVETGLVWQRVAPQGQSNQSAAAAACAGLGLEGRSFRLPTVKELSTLIAEEVGDPSAPRWDAEAFPPVTQPNGFFWTSTGAAGKALEAWTVRFYDGTTLVTTKASSAFHRCVSGP